jgi:hypothetical protein
MNSTQGKIKQEALEMVVYHAACGCCLSKYVKLTDSVTVMVIYSTKICQFNLI